MRCSKDVYAGVQLVGWMGIKSLIFWQSPPVIEYYYDFFLRSSKAEKVHFLHISVTKFLEFALILFVAAAGEGISNQRTLILAL